MPKTESNRFEINLARLQRDGDPELLSRGMVGLEKENLRVAKEGGIASSPHPAGLGSPLTHPWITTDYSEALLELVTPPFVDHQASLDFLRDLHIYVYQHLDDEILWSTSMPCILAGEENIPIATYGSSNAGRMKYVYRVGLGNRYGRVMQVIAGVHYNYSFADEFWPMYQDLAGDSQGLDRFRDYHYMGLIRNLQRYGWLIPYLFGASPAICKSFFNGKATRLDVFDDTTFYEPFATSLRMGDIGYQNRREEGVGIKACYDDLGAYVASLEKAISTPGLLWEDIGIKVNGEYRQLNANILQIENEYYSSIRPKQIPRDMEKPTMALTRRGISYVELRSLDVNAYHPLGVDENQVHFLESLMLYSLLADSQHITFQERREIDRNLLKVAHQGRDPALKLYRGGKQILLSHWAHEILDGMQAASELLDAGLPHSPYQQALDEQRNKVSYPEETPSGKMLTEMRDNGEGFYQIARRLSQAQYRYFSERKLSESRTRELDAITGQSILRQEEMEATDEVDFDTFLANYLAQ